MELVLIGYPLAIYVSLCLLPKARAGMGIILAAIALALVWITNDPARDNGFARFLVTLGAVPVALAALAQGLRRMIPDGEPFWIWPCIVVGLGLSSVALFFMLV